MITLLPRASCCLIVLVALLLSEWANQGILPARLPQPWPVPEHRPFLCIPGEASHGDLGMITKQDVVLALSNSGETEEILKILPLIKRLGVPLIAMTGNPASTLGDVATTHINVAVEQEACPLGLAPTSSTTAALVMGDALAVSLLEARDLPVTILPCLIPAAVWAEDYC